MDAPAPPGEPGVIALIELALRETAETVWARKLLVELHRSRIGNYVVAAHSHAAAIGQARGMALALVIAGERRIDLGTREKADAIVNLVVAEAAGVLWNLEKTMEQGPPPSLIPRLHRLTREVSWSEAVVEAARIPANI